MDKKKQANLTTVMLSQEYESEYWDWSDDEKSALGSAEETGKIILKRLEDAGLDVIEAYAVSHDRDEKSLWDEYESQYIQTLTKNHIHFLAKLNRGETLESLAEIIGIASQYIEKPKAGRYSYDNALSYLVAHKGYCQNI